MSTNTNVYAKALSMEKQNNVRKEMLSDPSTYPLILILGVACAGCSGFGFWFLTHSVDVRLYPSQRQQLVRDWSRQ